MSVIRDAFAAAKKNHSTLHLLGLVSDGGVHSHEDHLFALLEMARREGLSRVAVHAFTDGRDTPPTSGIGYLQTLEAKTREYGVGEIATIQGRYYAMDRDKRWERTQRAYEAMVLGTGNRVADWEQAVREAYARGETDEFLQPLVLVNGQGEPRATIRDKDAVIFFNFRADRARHLTYALTQEAFSGFERKRFPRLSYFAGFGEYDKNLTLPVAFPPVHLPHILAEELARHGLTQLRVAETEKYAHVTFFFNGGEEAVFPGESRSLIPSPREVPTYDLKPEMSAPAVGDEVVGALQKGGFDVIICNFANADMVGHTGILSAAIRAVETIDEQLGKIVRAVEKSNGTLLITADHGNCEQMADEKGHAHTAHTTDLVPFILVGERWKKVRLRNGGTLADIAPTMLQILELPQPREMTGRSLMES
jgi:2,3-bisphosphoglycerate-independent phosphoglycerate mutase